MLVEATLLHLNAIVPNLPSNSTHLCQLCDLFAILKIKMHGPIVGEKKVATHD
jgi:hypothetical protein